jgi:hypothetical protein
VETQRIGVMLGPCPKCGSINTVVINILNLDETICPECKSFFNLCDLLLSQGSGDELLIPSIMEIESQKNVVLIQPVAKNISFAPAVSKYIKTAAKVIWNAEFTEEKEIFYSADGKMWLSEYKHLIGFKRPGAKESNPLPNIPYGNSYWETLDTRYKRFFDWLESFMKLLFVENLPYKGFPFGKGEILKLSTEKPMHSPLARTFIYFALLESMKDKRKVFNILDHVKNDIDPRHIIIRSDGEEHSGEKMLEIIRGLS